MLYYRKVLKRLDTFPDKEIHIKKIRTVIYELSRNHCFIFEKVCLSNPFWVTSDIKKRLSKQELKIFLLLDELKDALFSIIIKALNIKSLGCSKSEFEELYQISLSFKDKCSNATLQIRSTKFFGCQNNLYTVVAYEII